MKNKFILFSFLISSVVSGSPLAELPSLIPFENIRPEATDLVWNGRKLTPIETASLRDRGLDISLIDPDATTDLWQPERNDTTSLDEKNLPLVSGETVRFLRTLESPLKIFRFIVIHRDRDGKERMYTALLAKRLQTFLLRRNLLRKLGYYVTPMKRLAKLRVEFSSAISKEDFIDNKSTGLRWGALGDKEWITNLNDKEAKHLDMQDILLMPAQVDVVNTAFPFVTPDFVQGRRVLNALLIPFNLVDVKESINGLRWHSAQIKSDSIYLPLEDQEGFSTTLADARWIMRRILSLQRGDWQEIVSNIGYPLAAEKLLTEKLISRRNELRRLLKLPGEDLAFNPTVSHGEDLVNGELLKEDWDGLAAKLSMGEKPSIVSGDEFRALFKSKLVSTTISDLVRRVNEDLIPHTDLEKIAFKKQKDRLLDDLIEHIKTGKPVKREFGIWSAPYISPRLIVSREVIAGSYLGTDNRVQLADTIGFGAETGLHLGTLGLKPDVFLDAKAKLFYFRQFSHLKPLHSIKTSLSEPYKNLIVPFVSKKLADLIDPTALNQQEGEEQEDYFERIKVIVGALKDNLGNGESFIVTDSIGAGGDIRAGYQFVERVKAQAQFSAGQLVLSRLHITRQDDKILIYKDLGNITSLQFVISLEAGIEVLSLRAKFSKGTATTEFYSLNLESDLESNPDLPLTLLGIRDALLENRVRTIQLTHEPNRIEHKVKETQSEFNFLFWNNFSLKNKDRVKITRPHETEPEYYVRRLIGRRSGLDYQTIVVDLINEIISESTGQDTQFSNTTSGDPGDTLFGKSKTRYSYFEGEVDPREGYKEMFVGTVYRWKGWSAKRSELEKIVNEFSKRFDFEFFHPQAFQQIKKAELYNLNLRIFVYDGGVRNAIALTQNQVYSLFEKYLIKNRNGETKKSDYVIRLTRSFMAQQRVVLKAIQKKNFDDVGDAVVKMISLLEMSLNLEGLLLAVGGKENILIQPILSGFLQGEDGKLAEIPIEGNEIGQVGSRRPLGPLTSTQIDMGMSEGEFFIYWLLKKI